MIRSLLFCLFVATWWHTATAWAYPWFIRDGYAHCLQCHADPSGAGLLTMYGRAQGELLLRTHYDAQEALDEEAGPVKDFMWGAFDFPEALLLGGDLRGGIAQTPQVTRWFESQADAQGQVKVDHFRVNASFGYSHADAQQARVTDNAQNNLVARSYWIGLDLGDDEESLLRVGRIALPFGLRTSEQGFLVHTLARNDFNDQQQLGIALAHSHDAWRAEAMAYVGNPQEREVRRWERGAATYVDYGVLPTLSVGLSALVAQSQEDVYVGQELLRASFGAFARYAPWHAWVLMAEFDGALHKLQFGEARGGYAGLLQSDVMLYPGVHVLASGEVLCTPEPGSSPRGRGRFGADYFFLPHADLRVDGIVAGDVATFLAQLHVYL